MIGDPSTLSQLGGWLAFLTLVAVATLVLDHYLKGPR